MNLWATRSLSFSLSLLIFERIKIEEMFARKDYSNNIHLSKAVINLLFSSFMLFVAISSHKYKYINNQNKLCDLEKRWRKKNEIHEIRFRCGQTKETYKVETNLKRLICHKLYFHLVNLSLSCLISVMTSASELL